MISLIFITVTICSLILFYFGTGKSKGVLVIGFLMILVFGAISYNGYFTNTLARPPRFLLVLLGATGMSVLFYRMTCKNKISPGFLMTVHTLRLPVELVLYQLFLQKKIPGLMTFKGFNFDILIGISAIIILSYLFLLKRQLSRSFILVWNTLGFFFLAFIVIIAILSSPLPVQLLAFDQPNIAVLQFPYIYLPSIIVPLVFLSHILVIKRYI